MAQLIDGKKVAQSIKDQVQREVEKLSTEYDLIPCLHAILIGDDPASQTYVRNKKKTCERLGMHSEIHSLPSDTETRVLEELVLVLNENSGVNGILIQLPLPSHIDQYKVMDQIDPYKDVDGFTPVNIARLYRGESYLEPCTPKGILMLLDYYDIPVEGENVVVVGRSDIVGKPLSLMMSSKKRNATVTLCHSRTKYLEYHTLTADIIVSAVGKPGYLTHEMIKEGSVVIDVGINRIDDPRTQRGYRLVGDVDFESVSSKARYITPVPGGVGPMTIACLMQNTLNACRLQNNI